MEWYLAVLKNYAGFSGRARRKEYWMFFLMNIVVSFVLAIILGVLGLAPLAGLYTLAIMIPSLAVGIRRLHDTGRSGWWLLITLIPFGAFVLLYFLASEGEAGPNQYGPNPKAA